MAVIIGPTPGYGDEAYTYHAAIGFYKPKGGWIRDTDKEHRAIQVLKPVEALFLPLKGIDENIDLKVKQMAIWLVF